MPPWTQGWLRAGVAWVGAQPPANQAVLTGRDIEAVSNHVLLMRTKASIDGSHTWSAAELGHSNRPWESKVYRAPWPKVGDLSGYQPGQGGQTANDKDQEYQRFNSYVDWSE